MRIAQVTSLMAIAVLIGCEATPPPPPTAAVLDSAGVRVVVNPRPDTTLVFRLSAEPRVSIGVTEGDPEYELSGVRTGTVLNRGTIVIANTRPSELRFYDGAGRYLRSGGRNGQGPGEFGAINLLGVFTGDSLLMSDGELQRMSVFDSAGTFVRSYPYPADLPGQPVPVGVLSDGRAVTLELFRPDTTGARGTARVPRRVDRIASDGSSLEPLGRFAGTEVVTGPRGFFPIIFARDLQATARGDRIAVGNNDGYSLRIYDGAGRLAQVIRQTREPVPVEPGDFERAQPLSPDLPPNVRADLEGMRAAMVRHATLPAFCFPWSPFQPCLLFDQAGNLWVSEYNPPWTLVEMVDDRPGIRRDATVRWHAFDQDGIFLGRLDLPATFTILDIGRDWLLGAERDELDVERVVLYGLERSASAP